MVLERHKLDPTRLQRPYRDACRRLPDFLHAAQENLKNLDLLISIATDVAAYGSVVDPQSENVRAAIKLLAQAHAALFAVARSAGEAIAVPLAGHLVRTSPTATLRGCDPGTWIEGYFLSALCRDVDSMQSLCQTPSPVLRQSSFQCPEYLYLLADSLRAFTETDPHTPDLLVSALEATNPDRPDIPDPDWVLCIDVPILELFFQLVTRKQQFASTWAKALELHKEYWGKKSRRYEPAGLLAIKLLGIGSLAYDRGLEVSVDSDYAPRWLITGHAT